MANQKAIRQRIRGIRQSLKITEAMHLISTAKMRKAKRMLDQSTPYFDMIRRTLADIVEHSQEMDKRYFYQAEDNPQRRTCFVVISSDRGQVGSLNQQIARLAEERCRQCPNPFIVNVGGKGLRHFVRMNVPVIEDFSALNKEPNMDLARKITFFITNQFNNKTIQEFYVIYTRMLSSVKTEPEIIRLLPLERRSLVKKTILESESGDFRYSYEPSAEAVFQQLIPQYLKGVIYGALVESYASEQSARMRAMDSASKNAREMLDKLSLALNRARQAIITQEISEIVASAASMEG